jgi:putative transposase
VRYRFLEEHKGEYRPIRKACEILGVSKSGYYEFRNRRKSNQQIEREALEGFVVEVFNEHKARYGYSRINRELRKIGITVSEKRVLGIMRAKGLQAKGTTRRYRIQKRIEPGDPRANLVEQVFTVPEPNRLWVGDITYIPTKRGFLFLATVIDTFSRKVVGWSMATTARENLVIDALEQAVGREDPVKGSSSTTTRAHSTPPGHSRRRLPVTGSPSPFPDPATPMTMRSPNRSSRRSSGNW